MSKVRLYELAREMGLEHTVLEARCRKLGIEVQNHLALLEVEEVDRLRSALASEPAAGVQEKRVRKTVIRRRRRADRDADKKPAAVATAPASESPEAAAPAPAPANTSTETAAEAGNDVTSHAEAAEPTPISEVESAVTEPPVAAQTEATAAAPVTADTTTAEGDTKAERAKARVRRDTKYGSGEAVNSRMAATETDEKRATFVTVVGKIDPALQQNLRREREVPARRSSPGTSGEPGSRNRGNRPMGNRTAAAIAPPADRRNKPGAAVDRHAKKRRGGRVAYDRTQDARFDDVRRQRNRRQPKRRTAGLSTEITIPKASKRVVKMDETIQVGELAQQLSVKASVIIRYLMDMGEMVTVNHVLDLDTVTLIAQEHEFTVENVAFNLEEIVGTIGEDDAVWVSRQPTVTVMGHVDHGKTSLLDYIRSARVASGEAGGITQHIGAYKVPVTVNDEERDLVFLDTPGHAAFTAMRARGAQVTDVVILVTAADDGVMPQTEEAIAHAKAAGVPIVVAINKCDKEDAQPDKVRQQLTEHGLVPEEWGGDAQMINCSAMTGDGVDQLLEAVALQSEMLDLKAISNGRGKGVVIEAELSRGRGPVATILVQQGVVRTGDTVVAGRAMGRVRALIDDRGRQLKEAGPSTPVEVLGLNEVPPPSEHLYVVKDEKDARQIVTHLTDKDRSKRLASERKRVSLDDLAKMVEEGDIKTLGLIIKSDVQGSLEALRGSFGKLEHPELDVRIIHGGVGPISESDIALAAASDAIVVGFNVRPEKKAKEAAEKDNVDIKLYSVIYDAIDDVKAAMEGLLSPVIQEQAVGKAEVREVFNLKGQGNVAGCAVLQGKVVRNGLVRLVRDGRVIYSGRVGSLRRFKDQATEVERGKECGIQLHNYGDVKIGDEIECYEEVAIKQTLDI